MTAQLIRKAAAIFFAALLVFAFAGCPDNLDGTDTIPVPVTDVSVADEDGESSSIIWANVGANPNDLPTDIELTATITPADASNKEVIWLSSHPAIVSVSPLTGSTTTVTAVEVGNATITVTTVDGNKNAVYSVEVKNANTYVAVTGVKIVHNDQDVTELSFNKVGNNFDGAKQLDLEFTPSDATPLAVKWSVDPADVVTVDNGLVTPVGIGEATITVTINGTITARVDVTVDEVDIGAFDPVETVEVTPDEPLTFTKTGDGPFDPLSVTLDATVSPETAYPEVIWKSDNVNVATVSDEGVVTPVGHGTTQIYATSVGKDADDQTVKSNEVEVTVSVDGGGTPGGPELVLYNQAGSPAAGTTTDLETAWNDTTKKYTIKNAETGGEFVAGSSAGTDGVKNATIVYLDTPLTGNTVSISARVRIKAMVAQDPSDTHGVIMGLMADPQETKVPFFGMRATTKNLWRPYNSRNNAANTSSALTVANSSGFSEENIGTGSTNSYISRIDGVMIPFDEEFILETERTNATAYTVRLKDYAGNLIATGSYSNNVLGSMTMEYPGFIIANAEVEISQITIKEGTDTVFWTANSTSTPTPVTSVEFTAPAGIMGDATNGYEYTHSTSAGTELTLTAQAIPARAPQDINWAISGASPATAANTASVNLTNIPATDGSTVTATASAGGQSATLTINVTTGTILVNSITISAAGDASSIMAGDGGSNEPETLQFTEEVDPGNAANSVVTWSVSDSSTYSANNSASGGSIDNNGLLTAAATLAADTDIWVFAAATDGSNVKSAGVQITVKPYAAEVTTVWRFNATTAVAAGLSLGSSYYDISSETDFGKGLILTTGATAIRQSQGSTGLNPSITGCLQLSGATSSWGKLTGISGGFTLEIIYANTGSGNSDDRYPTIRIGSTTSNVRGNTIANTGNAATGIVALVADGTDIIFGASAAIRIFEVKLTREALVVTAAENVNTITAGDDTEEPIVEAETLQFTATNYTVTGSSNVTTDASTTWSIKNSAGAAITDSDIASISSTGKLTAGKDLDNDVDVYVFAEFGSKTSVGYKVTVKKYVASEGDEYTGPKVIYNFTDATFNTLSTTEPVGGLTFGTGLSLTNNAASIDDNGYTVSGLTRAVQTGGAASASQRYIVVPLDGPARVTVYATSNNSTTTFTIGISEGTTAALSASTAVPSATTSPNNTIGPWRAQANPVVLSSSGNGAYSYSSATTGVHYLALKSSGSMRIFLIKVEYKE